MKRHIALVIFSLLVNSTFSQIKFEKGYFINNDGEKTECLIKNMDWEKNPSKITYKLIENSSPQVATIDEISNFEIIGATKYEKHTVKIDVSSQNTTSLDTKIDPTFVGKELFLKVLLEGNANLYEFKSNNISKKFFYSVNLSNVKQLVYKKYAKNGANGTNIKQNKAYIFQLFKYVNCGNKNPELLKKVEYSKADLKKHFNEHNLCFDPSYSKKKNDKDNGSKRKSHFKIVSGININTYKIRGTDFDTKISPRIGFEYELILPLNKNKWGIFIEPTFRFYKAQGNTNISGLPNPMEVKFNAIELPIGLRHYMFLNDKSKIFINASYVFDLALNSYEWKRDVENSRSYFFGIGYNFNDKASLEIRSYSSKEDVTSLGTLSQKSIVLGYNF